MVSVGAAVVWHIASALRFLILEDENGWIYWRSATSLLCQDEPEAIPADLETLEALLMEISLDEEGAREG